MSTPSLTIENRRYVWAESAAKARDKIASELRSEGIPTALQPKLDVKWIGVSRAGSYDFDYDGVDVYVEHIGKTSRRYAIDIRS